MSNVVVLPFNIEAEQAVIGAMLINDEAIYYASNHLTKDDFYRKDHSIIFEAIRIMQLHSMPVDIVTVSEYLIKNNLMNEAGGPTLLTRLLNAVPTAANVGYYAKIVKEKALERRLWYTLNDLSGMIGKTELSAEELLEKAKLALNDIDSSSGETSMQPASTIVTETLANIETGNNYGLLTGWEPLNRAIRGFKKGKVYIIAGRAHMGKTAVTLDLIRQLAVERKYKVQFYNLEMSNNQLMERLICSEAKVDYQTVLGREPNEKLPDSVWSKIMLSASKIYEAPLKMSDKVSQIDFMCNEIRREKNQGNIDILFIDYMQLIEATEKFHSNQECVQYVSRRLKLLAKELEIPVVALAQLNRSVESRVDKRPMMSDLRDSGAIEQDADVIMMLYRDDYYKNDGQTDNLTEILIRKNREAGGSYETVKIYWDDKKSIFFCIDEKKKNNTGNKKTEPPHTMQSVMKKMEQGNLITDSDYMYEEN